MADAAEVLSTENATEQPADAAVENNAAADAVKETAPDPLAVVPDSIEGYELPVPEGDDGAFSKTAAEWFKDAGLPKGQAQALASKWNEYAAAQQKAYAEQQAAEAAKVAEQVKADDAALKNEWGDKYDANIELGRRAVRQFQVSADVLEAIESKVGYGQMLRMFSRIGAGLAEDSAVGLNAPRAGSELTPEQKLYGTS